MKNELGTATSSARVLVDLPPDVQTVTANTYTAEQLIENAATATVAKRRPSFVRALANQIFVEEEGTIELEVQVRVGCSKLKKNSDAYANEQSRSYVETAS